MNASSPRTILLAGTHKGAFLFVSNEKRTQWELQGPFFPGLDVNDFRCDLRQEPPRLLAAVSSWKGHGVHCSRDLGQTWEAPEAPLFFDDHDAPIKRLWVVEPGAPETPGVLYAGVDPAALMKSEDGGKTWQEVGGLLNHPTRERWQPGGGGMMVHSICVHPSQPHKIHVGISAAGVFSTGDGGATWEPRNRGVRADFQEEKYPEVGQCVHHLAMHPDRPEVLYQQNHCGVYRSDNEGREWVDISEGLPSRFGFPLLIHPHDPDTIYVIPEQGETYRVPIDTEFAVYRSRNRGETWEKLNRGLPGPHAYLNVLRQAMAADSGDPCGIYVATNTGQIFYSLDEGDSWSLLANWLPPIYSLSAAMI